MRESHSVSSQIEHANETKQIIIVIVVTGIGLLSTVSTPFLAVVISQLDDSAYSRLCQDKINEAGEVPGLGVEVRLEQQPDAVEVARLGVEEGEVRLHRFKLQVPGLASNLGRGNKGFQVRGEVQVPGRRSPPPKTPHRRRCRWC